jgi:hypothetical protein
MPHRTRRRLHAHGFDEDGNLYGNKTGRLPDFLANPPGSALPNEISALLDMFAMQSRSGGVYDRKCAVCHTIAKRLARVRLELKDGRLADRVTGSDIPDFLTDHGRVDAGEIEMITRMLTWQIQTSGP